jgi:hypothetical protein
MNKILVLFFSLGISFGCLAQKGQQTFGLLGSSEVTSVFTGPFYEPEPAFSFSGGVFYDLNIGRRFGFNIAPSQRTSEQEVMWNWCIDCIWGLPSFNQYAIHTLEVPVNLTLDLSTREVAKWKTYFAMGYTFTYLYMIRDKETGDLVNVSDFFWINRNKHYLNVGLEVRHTFLENYILTLNPVARLGVTYEVENPALGLNLKIGRIL